jgi:hypothetical protein
MEHDNIYDGDIIITDDAGQFILGEQKTNELRFINGKLYQKIITTNFNSNILIEERWELIEGQ